MIRHFARVQRQVWLLLALMVMVAAVSFVIRTGELVPPSTFLFIIQPLMMLGVGALTYALAHHAHDRIRRKRDRAIMVGSVLAIWFVAYMTTGLVVTYVNNALSSSFVGLIQNIIAFALPAAVIEYSRHKVIALLGRRDVFRMAALVAVVFALPQIATTPLTNLGDLQSSIELIFGTMLPTLVASILLTYLAITSGLASQLTFALGMTAATILPPFIPDFDWYMLGMNSILLSIAVYITIDRSARGRARGHRHRAHSPDRAYDIMLLIALGALVLFMTGSFAYKPMVIMSNSMQPAYSRGAVVISETTIDPLDIREGDILQYERDGTLITHRVVAVDDRNGERTYTTKGDNSPSEDPPVSTEQVHGVIRSSVPYIGYPTVWLRELGG